MKECIKDLSVSDKCTIVRAYTEIDFEIEYIYEILEPYIHNGAKDASSFDFVNALIGYQNPKIPQYPLANDLNVLAKEKISKLPLQGSFEVLRYMATRRIGSHELITELKDTIFMNLTKENEEEIKEIIASLIPTLDMVGVESTELETLLPYLEKSYKKFNFEEASLVHRVISKFSNNPQFVQLELSLRQKVEQMEK